MDIIKQEKIKATKQALDEANKSYQNIKIEYDKAESAYNKYKAAVIDIDNQDINIDNFNNKKEVILLLGIKAKAEFEQSKKALDAIKKRIIIIQEQIGIITKKRSLKDQTELEKKRNKDKVKDNNKKIKINKVRLKKDLSKTIKTSGTIAIIYTLSKIINNQITKLSKTIQNLGTLVDRTNDIIRSANTTQDIKRSKVVRDAALVTLKSAEDQVKRLDRTLKSVNRSLVIMSTILRVVSSLPIAPYQLAPVAVKTTRIIANINPVILALSVLLQISTYTLDGFLADIRYERSRLLPLNRILNMDDSLGPEEIKNLIELNNDSGLGIMDGMVYKGFTFEILEEDDPRYVVSGNKRRYAVALDRSSFIALQSEPSFTLDPNVLIEELKLEIDIRNLIA